MRTTQLTATIMVTLRDASVFWSLYWYNLVRINVYDPAYIWL